MLPLDYTKASLIGREAATLVKAQRGSLRDVERIARARDMKVSRAALERALNAGHDVARKPNAQIVDFAIDEFSAELAQEHGYARTDEDIADVRAWFALNHSDARLLSGASEDADWLEDATLARVIVSRPLRSRPFSLVVRASALLHLWRNPAQDAQARESARDEAISLLEAVADVEGYSGLALDELLGPEGSALPETDFSGVLVSIALNLLVLARGGDSDAAWKVFLEDLAVRGLLPQLAVRGVFFSEPKTLVNSAEIYWMLDRLKEARLLLRHAESLDNDNGRWIAQTGAAFYEPGFVSFALDPNT